MSLVPDGEHGSKLQSRKHNNYPWGGAYMVTSDWLDGIPRNVTERSYAVSLAERIAEVLKGGSMTLAEIVAGLNGEDQDGEPVKRDTIRRTLQRGLTTTPKVWTVRGERWLLVENDDQGATDKIRTDG